MRKVAGLDLSINSTGICIEGEKYYNIVPKLTKNHLSNTNKNFFIKLNPINIIKIYY